MWTVLESKEAAKILDKLPPNILEKYEFWCSVVRMSGPAGLRHIKGFHDEKLQGKLRGLRSSRLSLQWRVVYQVESSIVTVLVDKITPHKY
jgi:mRNA-degrading endonuclease RelE of RelBE toxin-antitoxin system